VLSADKPQPPPALPRCTQACTDAEVSQLSGLLQALGLVKPLPGKQAGPLISPDQLEAQLLQGAGQFLQVASGERGEGTD